MPYLPRLAPETEPKPEEDSLADWILLISILAGLITFLIVWVVPTITFIITKITLITWETVPYILMGWAIICMIIVLMKK